MTSMIKAAALAATLLAAPTAALAQAAATGVIIVDMDRVGATSAAGKSAQSQLQAKLTGAQQRAQTLSQGFKAEEDALRKAQSTNSMAPAAFQAKVKDLQTRQVNAQNELNNRRQDLANSEVYVRRQIIDAVNPIIAQVMRERNASVVVAREATLSYNPALDVTPIVIQRLDAALRTVSVTPPAQPAAKAK